ncbi:MAG TPA: hypothetical protein VJ453_13810, partial [Terriglobales bacterium]|nr:hypothetical protein [Terriglobales bacterium]
MARFETRGFTRAVDNGGVDPLKGASSRKRKRAASRCAAVEQAIATDMQIALGVYPAQNARALTQKNVAFGEKSTKEPLRSAANITGRVEIFESAK